MAEHEEDSRRQAQPHRLRVAHEEDQYHRDEKEEKDAGSIDREPAGNRGRRTLWLRGRHGRRIDRDGGLWHGHAAERAQGSRLLLMAKIPLNLREDIQPVSDLETRATNLLRQVQETRRPVVLTESGKGAAVLVDLETYQDLLEETDRRIRNGITAPPEPGPFAYPRCCGSPRR
jgi:prevent-host-death family protein